MATHAHTTRREVLKAMPAASAAAMLPIAAASADTPILRLFARWYALSDRRVHSDEESAAIVDAMIALEAEMAEHPSTSRADLAAKIAAETSFGDFGFCEKTSAELRTLTAEAVGGAPVRAFTPSPASADPHAIEDFGPHIFGNIADDVDEKTFRSVLETLRRLS